MRKDHRCPVCGEGILVDLSFDANADEEPKQAAGSRETLTFSCGHRTLGGRLDGADQEELDVERRRSSETTMPLPDADEARE